MFEKHVGSVIITDVDQKCAGIFTERDVIRVNAQDVPLDIPVEKAMTKNVYTVLETAPFEDARHIIRARRVRHLPVTNSDGKVVGLLSIRHLFDMLFEM
jgi:CBS domain-containing protein